MPITRRLLRLCLRRWIWTSALG